MHKLINSLFHLDQRPNMVLRFADRYLEFPLLPWFAQETYCRRQLRASIGILGNPQQLYMSSYRSNSDIRKACQGKADCFRTWRTVRRSAA
jgi:hypothetical protein